MPTNIKNNPLPINDLSNENKLIINEIPSSLSTIIRENSLWKINGKIKYILTSYKKRVKPEKKLNLIF